MKFKLIKNKKMYIFYNKIHYILGKYTYIIGGVRFDPLDRDSRPGLLGSWLVRCVWLKTNERKLSWWDPCDVLASGAFSLIFYLFYIIYM